MISQADTAPLILTLGFDGASAARFDDMRRHHFPTKRNVIPAHLTLFHKLPGDHLLSVAQDIRDVVGTTPAFALRVDGLRFLGYGSAYTLTGGPLVRLRAELARRWADVLTAQDAQRFAPHVTIQNKVASTAARSLFERLSEDFEPFDVEAEGLLLWHYRGGPWEPAGKFPFTS